MRRKFYDCICLVWGGGGGGISANIRLEIDLKTCEHNYTLRIFQSIQLILLWYLFSFKYVLRIFKALCNSFSFQVGTKCDLPSNVPDEQIEASNFLTLSGF